MTRKYIDCRETPGNVKCSLALCADTEAELVEACVHHAVSVHQEKDTPELRQMLKSVMKDGTAPLERQKMAA